VAEEARGLLGVEMPRRASYELARGRDIEIILVDGAPVFAVISGKLVPTLHYLLVNRKAMEHLPRVVVDEGAVAPVSRGADIMAPGITEVRGEFGKGSIVVVVDPRHGMPLAVAEALFSSEEIKEMRKGKVLRNLHHVGDRIWRAAPPPRLGR